MIAMLGAMTQSAADNTGSGAGTTLIALVFYIISVAGLWRVFTKAGQPGWAAIIPIYNALVLLRIVGRPWWWLILFLIPLVNIVFAIIFYNDLSKSFGHGVGFTIGLIVLSVIFFLILGFGSSTYRGPAAGNP